MKKLAIMQIVLGILVVGSLIYWGGWVSTGYHDLIVVDDDGNIILRVLGLSGYIPYWMSGYSFI